MLMLLGVLCFWAHAGEKETETGVGLEGITETGMDGQCSGCESGGGQTRGQGGWSVSNT
jgi:hypothetical protein